MQVLHCSKVRGRSGRFLTSFAGVVGLFLATGLAVTAAVAHDEANSASEQPPAPAPAADAPPAAAELATQHPFPNRIKAPPLDGGVSWINTGGPLDLKSLRGKFVVLDFWTYCCINCMHILPELKKLEHAYPNSVVVIGVHSAKFDTEKESKNITEAVLRHDIEHPVVNDAEHAIWNRYAVRSWPSLRVIDPEGNLIVGHSGEIDFETLDEFFKSAMPYYRKKGVLDETPIRFDLERDRIEHGPLHFPGKVLADEASGRMFIADSGHNRIVIASLDGKLVDVIGSGQRGKADGGYKAASFASPQGMTLHNGQLYVADTENHMIRKVDLTAKRVETIAGTGKQNRGIPPGIDPDDPRSSLIDGLPERWVSPPKSFPLASPWAVLVHGEHLYIAMAGPHQIWRMTLDEKEIEVFAGSGVENITDGPLTPPQPIRLMGRGVDRGAYSAFAQPSGLASDGTWLYVADSEGSAIRAVPFDATKEVKTVVGVNDKTPGPRGRPIYPLFSFGDRDGVGEKVLLQHATGVTIHDGKLYVCDTYNNKIKVIDIAEQRAESLVGSNEPGAGDEPARFDEPMGITYVDGKLLVADTNNHQVRVVDLASRAVTTLKIGGLTPPALEKKSVGLAPTKEPIQLEGVKVRPARDVVRLDVKLGLPEGWKINTLAPMSYQIDLDGPAGPFVAGELGSAVRVPKEKRQVDFSVKIPVSETQGSAQIQVTLRYYYCQEGAEGLCKVGKATWSVDLALADDGDSAVVLEHQVP